MPFITTASGLQYEDTTEGAGATATRGQSVTVHYTGWLYNDGVQGAKFDSSKDRNDPFVFALALWTSLQGYVQRASADMLRVGALPARTPSCASLAKERAVRRLNGMTHASGGRMSGPVLR